jgi:BASS family bile acid:Na+ symporter
MLASVTAFLLRHLMAALMLSVGLHTPISELRATWAQRTVIWKALIVLFIGVPLLALLTVAVLPLGDRAAAFVVIMAVCPGAPLVFRTFRDRRLVVAIIALVGLAAPLAVWAWISAVGRFSPLHVHVEARTLARVALEQLLPLGIGVALASTLPRVARPLARIAWYFFALSFAVAIVVAIVKGGRELLTVDGWAILAVLVMVAGSIALGHWAGRPQRENSRLLATMAVLGNPALAIAVIASTDPGFRPGALFFAYLIARAIFLLPYAQWSKRWARRPPRRVTFGPASKLPPASVPGH